MVCDEDSAKKERKKRAAVDVIGREDIALGRRSKLSNRSNTKIVNNGCLKQYGSTNRREWEYMYDVQRQWKSMARDKFETF